MPQSTGQMKQTGWKNEVTKVTGSIAITVSYATPHLISYTGWQVSSCIMGKINLRKALKVDKVALLSDIC